MDADATDRTWLAGRPEGVRWGLPEAVGAIVFAALLIGLSGLVPVSGFLLYGLMIAAAYLVVRLRGTGNPIRDLGLLMLPKDLLFGITISIVGRVAGVFAITVARGITGSAPRSGNLEIPDDVPGLVFSLLLAIVVAPLAEELLIRGLLLRAVLWAGIARGARRPAAIAVVVSSLVFGALHVPQAIGDPALLVALFLSTSAMGAVLAVVTLRVGRLGPAIAGHSFFNATSLLVSLAS